MKKKKNLVGFFLMSGIVRETSKLIKTDNFSCGTGGGSFYQLLSIFYETSFSPHLTETRWKNWFHFGLKIGFMCPGCMAKVLAIACVGLCLTFSPYSRASFSVFSTCCFVYLATSRIGFDCHL